MNAHMPSSSLYKPHDHLLKSSPAISSPSALDRRSCFPPTPSGTVKAADSASVDALKKTTATASETCICDRPASHIVCTRCGYELVGRLQRVCPEHPKKLALMDHRECPNRLCRSIHLIEVSLEK
ncbi:unnamed protein product [Toxocara canis]|nr:unnamed protein product [Toxocara canis]